MGNSRHFESAGRKAAAMSLQSTLPQRSLSGKRSARAYTLIEALVCIAILSVITSLAVVPLASLNDSTRLDAVMKRSTSMLRYARMLAMSSGQPCSVEFNGNTQTIAVYLGSATTPAPNALFSNNSCSLNLLSDAGVSGVRISDISNGGSPARFTYGTLGTRINPPTYASPMAVTFTCGKGAATLTIPNAGEPQ
jgi:prepilin-type N-terminal cleavage/methylation domain-containing protein